MFPVGTQFNSALLYAIQGVPLQPATYVMHQVYEDSAAT